MTIRLPRRFLLFGVATALVSCHTDTEPDPEPTPPTQPKPSAIVLSAPDSVLGRGQVVQFTATLVDSTGSPLSGGTFTWASQFPAIATVAEDGTVVGVDAGDTEITVVAGALTAHVLVQVRDSVSAVRIMLQRTPFGLAVHGEMALVTLISEDSAIRINLTDLSATPPIWVCGNPTGVAFDPSGTLAYFACLDGRISVVSPSSMLLVDTAAYAVGLAGVFATAAGKLWVTSQWLDRVYAVDPGSHQLLDSTTVAGGPNWIAGNPVLPRLYVNGLGAGMVYELDAGTLDSLRSWHLGGRPQGMAVSADGNTLYVANEDNWLDVISLGSGIVAAHVTLPKGAFGLALSPDESRVAMTLGNSVPDVVVLSTSTLATVQTFYSRGRPRRLVYTTEGTHLLIANEMGWVDYLR